MSTTTRYSYRAINRDERHVVGTITIAEDAVGRWVAARYRAGWHQLVMTEAATGSRPAVAARSETEQN